MTSFDLGGIGVFMVAQHFFFHLPQTNVVKHINHEITSMVKILELK